MLVVRAETRKFSLWMGCDDFMSVELCREVVLGKGFGCCRLYNLGWMDVWLVFIQWDDCLDLLFG
jgi:hypothetical protein